MNKKIKVHNLTEFNFETIYLKDGKFMVESRNQNGDIVTEKLSDYGEDIKSFYIRSKK